MPINTDLNIYPYSDDYDEKKDFNKILFKPGVPVQVRELNQLQTILQKQVERFGDNIYTQGTIIKGCALKFFPNVDYVKLLDKEVDTSPINVDLYTNLYARNSNGVLARISLVEKGFESTDPDLNTLFLEYVTSGVSNTKKTFVPGETLQISSPNGGIIDVDIITPSKSFSNNDIPVFTSTILVKSQFDEGFRNTSGSACTFIIGETIKSVGAGTFELEIKEANTTIAEATDNILLLKVKPTAKNLRLGNTISWDIRNISKIISSNSNIECEVIKVIGGGAAGSILTNSSGGITTVIPTKKGSGYKYMPDLSVYYNTPKTDSVYEADISALNLKPKDYLAEVTIASQPSSVGQGYGVSVSEGIIYQKGYFSRVNSGFTIVEKYNNLPNKIVGFDTVEEIINFRNDSSLNDNSLTTNQNAPGADRLKLTPQLIAIEESERQDYPDFFSVVEFNEGRPWLQRSSTVFNSINKELAKRTFEESGNYIIDPFLTRLQAADTLEESTEYFEVLIDPGTAYVAGNRVQTQKNYAKKIKKGIDTTTYNTSITLQYGNYCKVRELGGLFQFNTGAEVKLYNQAQQYLTNYPANKNFGSMNGTQIGTATIRSLTPATYAVSPPGTPNSVYNLYIFEVFMNDGYNFSDVKSVFYDPPSGEKGVADLVLENNQAKRYETGYNKLLFPVGNAIKNISNTKYTYRTINNSAELITTGLTDQLSTSNEYFPYTGTLNSTEKKDILLVPFDDGACANAAIKVSVSGGTIANTSNPNWHVGLEIGDYVLFGDDAAQTESRIVAKPNSTTLQIANTSASVSSANIALFFPENIPISLENRNVEIIANTTISVSLGNTITSATSINAAIAYNVVSSKNQVQKTVYRKQYVKIAAGTGNNKTGPWNLGVPDIIQLRGVYLGSTSSVTTSDKNITNNFYIDHKQNKHSYRESTLHRTTNYNIPDNYYLLVEFDCLVPSTEGGLKTVSSYPIDDSLTINESDSTINTIEIPEIEIYDNEYYDLRDCLDLRPYRARSANLVSSSDATDISIITTKNQFNQDANYDTTSEKRFPAPGSKCDLTVEQYLGRIDTLYIDKNGYFQCVSGESSRFPKPKTVPNSTGMFLDYINIPPYPSYPKNIAAQYKKFIAKKAQSGNSPSNKRLSRYTVTTPRNKHNQNLFQPKRYTMQEIGQLERRISDLEYYTAMSLTENQINQLQIPSGIDGSERHKFGFFVDTFRTSKYADATDPKFNARIWNYDLIPERKGYNIEYMVNVLDDDTMACYNPTTGMMTIPFEQETLIMQDKVAAPTTILVETTYTVTTSETDERLRYGTRIEEWDITRYWERVREQLEWVEEWDKRRIQVGTETTYEADGQKYTYIGTNGGPHTAGRVSGYIYVAGGKGKKNSAPLLQRKINNVWSTVAPGSDAIYADGKEINSYSSNWGVGSVYSSDKRSWMRRYAYTAREDGDGTQFQLVGGFGEGYFSWPGHKEVTTPVYGWEDYLVSADYQPIPGTEQIDPLSNNEIKFVSVPINQTYIANVAYWSNTYSLFSSSRTTLFEFEKLFTTGAMIDEHVNLLDAIYDDINDGLRIGNLGLENF